MLDLNLWLSTIIIFGLIVVCLFSTATIAKYVSFEFARKYGHFFTVGIGIVTPLFFELNSFSIFSIIIIGALPLLYIRTKNKSISNLLNTTTRKTYGDVCLIIGMGYLWFFVPNYTIYIVLLLVIGVSDSLAAIFPEIIYKKLGKEKPHKKTHLGSFVFFVSTLIILIVANLLSTDSIDFNIIKIILVALILTIIERLSYFGIDNFFVLFIGEILLSM